MIPVFVKHLAVAIRTPDKTEDVGIGVVVELLHGWSQPVLHIVHLFQHHHIADALVGFFTAIHQGWVSGEV